MTQSNERFLQTQFKRLSLLKATPNEPEAIRSWAESVEPVLVRYGAKAFSDAVTRCLNKMEYFPMPAVFREQIQEPEEWKAERKRQEAQEREAIIAYQQSDEGKRDLEELKASLRELGRKYGIVRSEERGEEERDEQR